MGKKLLAFVLSVMLLMTATAAFAAETLLIDGYPDYEKDEYIAEHQVSISNVIGETDELEIGLMTTYVCQAPVVVTELDKLEIFYAAPLVLAEDDVTYIEDGYYAPNGEYREDDYWMNWEDIIVEFAEYENGEITIAEPGIYHVCGGYTAIAGGVDVVLIVEGDAEAEAPATEEVVAPEEPVVETAYAYYTKSTVLVDGTPVEFEAYNINDNNYFKLRDIAMAFVGKDDEFGVSWSEADNAIMIDRKESYEPVGGELAKGDGMDKTAIVSSVSVLEPMQGGFWPPLTVYNINGNNYFKLRDLGMYLQFNVDWDAASSTVIIDTVSDFVYPEY